MTDHSAILQFVKDPATDCKTGARFEAHGGCALTLTINHDLQTGKRKPTLPTQHDPKQTRMLSMAVVEICGDCYEAAAWLQQLAYWESRATVIIDGVRWIKDSATDLEKHMRFSRRTVDKVNEKLVEAGFIAIEVKPWKGYKYKSPTRHYRITDKARPFLIPPVQNVQMVEAPDKAYVQNVQVVSKAYVQNVQVTENTKDTENTKNQTLNSVATKPATTSIQDLQQAAEAAGVMNKTTPVQPSPAKQPEPAQPGQFEEPYIGPDKTKTLPNGKQPSKAVKHWMLVYEQTYGEKPPKPLRPAMRNFHHALNVSMRDAINGESLAFIDFVFANYTKGRNLLWNSRCVSGGDLHLRNRPMMEDISKHREFFTQQYLAFRDGPAIQAKEQAAYAAKKAAKDAVYEKAQKEKAEKAKIEAVAMKAQALTDKIEQLVMLLGESGTVVDLATLSLEPNDSDAPMMKKLKQVVAEKKGEQPATVPDPVLATPTVDDYECLGLDPTQSTAPWAAKEVAVWMAQRAAELAVQAAAKAKLPAKRYHA